MPKAQASRGGSSVKKTQTGSASRKTAEAMRIKKYVQNQAKLAKKIGKRDR